jgi:hypothetical protein
MKKFITILDKTINGAHHKSFNSNDEFSKKEGKKIIIKKQEYITTYYFIYNFRIYGKR